MSIRRLLFLPLYLQTECFNSAQTRQKGEPFWGLKEISLMFEDCTSLPFEDIEAAEKYVPICYVSWPLA